MKIIDTVNRLRKQKPLENHFYYQVTLLGLSNGQTYVSCNSQFKDMIKEKGKPLREIRVARRVNPELLMEHYESMKEPALLINTKEELMVFLAYGGHALIEENVAKEEIPRIVGPKEVIHTSPMGYLNTESLPRKHLSHHISPSMRILVLKRDQFTCQKCGFYPDKDEDVSLLEAHHIQTWAKYGGITRLDNLITLCRKCNRTIGESFDQELYQKVETLGARIDKFMNPPEELPYDEGVRAYQMTFREIMTKKKSSENY